MSMFRSVKMFRMLNKSTVMQLGQQTRVQGSASAMKQVNTAMSMPSHAVNVKSGSNTGYASAVGTSFSTAPQAGVQAVKASPLTSQGFGQKGFVAARMNKPFGARGFATQPAMKSGQRKAGTLNISDVYGSREARRAAMQAEAITADAAPMEQRRLFGYTKPFGDDAKTRAYRFGGLAVFAGMLMIIHPWFSLNWLKLYRAQAIKKEEGLYTAYFGEGHKTVQQIQDEVAGRHKTHTKFRVLKNLDTEGKMIHRQRGGTPQLGRGNENMGKFT